jgi:hypothetical protein
MACGDMDMRRAANCALYPACYWAGDCGFENWRTGNCGLSADEQKAIRDKWRADLALRNARWRLGKDLASRAAAGEFDHLLASADTHPKDGDAKQAPLVSGAVPEGKTPEGGSQ